MIQKFHMRRDDTGEEYVRSCDIALLETRKIGDKPIKLGTKFTCVSKLDGSTFVETLTGVGKKGRAATTRTWILRSDACGINPDQRLEAMKADEKNGCPIDYDEAGRAIFRSPGQYRNWCQAHGFFSRNGGHGDPQRLDSREREIRGLPQQAYLAENTDYE
jgi:hypothetical protein